MSVIPGPPYGSTFKFLKNVLPLKIALSLLWFYYQTQTNTRYKRALFDPHPAYLENSVIIVSLIPAD